MVRDALVVGISHYQHLPSLNAPAHDAEAIAHELETNGDFQVARLPEIVQDGRLRVGQKTPVTLTDLETALVRLFKPSGANIPHTALFYFSGHGLQKEAGIREGYLATSDANPETNFYGLSLFWLRRLLQESPVRQRIILLDCCHSGEILNFLEADPGAHAGTDRLFMAASREYETAYESLTSPYSVFTEALLAGLDARRLPAGVVTNYALTDWVSNALKGESQQPLFENSGSEIVLTRCQNPLTLMLPAPVEDVCPYRGLQPFREEHAEYFFGREGLTDQLLDRLRTGNFLAVIGASGSGKSSVVRAGLAHKLQRGQAISGSDRWQIRLMTPTEHPFKSLANAFVSPDAPPVERAEQLRRAELFLQDGSAGLSHLIRASLMTDKKSEASPSRFVLIIDQFEEVFTLCQGHNTEHIRHRFFNCLLAGVRELGDRFKLVIVLRADFFSKCSFYKGLAEHIEQHLVMVTPLSYDQIKASILKPAAKVGLVCDPNLVYNILLDIVGAPGELPLLQYTLMELWQRRYYPPEGGAPHLTLDAYTALGGVRGTLQKRADEIFYSLELEEQQVAKRIFIALTQLGEGTEDTRRRVLKSELVGGQFPPTLVETVVEKLVRAKLIVTNQIMTGGSHQGQVDQRFANISTALRLAQVARKKSPKVEPSRLWATGGGAETKGYDFNVIQLTQSFDLKASQDSLDGGSQETVDIAHEALIRNWALLRSWLDENREVLRRLRRIERAAQEWHSAQQPRSPEFLLHGSRLVDAEDFWHHYPHELSQQAQEYLTISREESRRVRHELRLLQVSIPLTLLVALGVTFAQYKVAADSRSEKDYQLHIATSRQWSAIAQSILQEPEGDPMAALLISRLAAERGQTMEAESSVRSALQKLQLQANLVQGPAGIQDFAVNPAQTQIATVDTEGTVRLWALATTQIERVLQDDQGGDRAEQGTPKPPAIRKVLFTPAGDSLLAVGRSATHITLWATATGQVQHRFEGFTDPIQAIALSPQGHWLAASSGNTVRVWQLSTGQLHGQFQHRGTIQTLAFTADERGILVASPQAVAVWTVAQPKRQQTFGLGSTFDGVALSPGGQEVAIAERSGRVGIWRLDTGRQLHVLNLPKPTPATVATAPTTATQFTTLLQFSPDGQKLGWSNGRGQFGVWQWPTGNAWNGKQQAEAAPTEVSLPQLRFSPDSQQVWVSDRRDRPDLPTAHPLRLWEAATGKALGQLVGHGAPLTGLQYTTDGSLLLSTGLDGAVRLWAIQPTSEFPTVRLALPPLQSTAFVWPPGQAQGDRPVPPFANSAPCATPPTLGLRVMTEKSELHQWNLVGAERPDPPKPQATCPLEPEIHQAAGGAWHPLQQRLSHLWQRLSQKADSLATANEVVLRGKWSPTVPTFSAIAASIAPPAAVKNLLATGDDAQRLLAAAFSRDGNLVAIATNLGTVTVWQSQPDQSFQLVRSWAVASEPPAPNAAPAPTQILRQLAFSPDGQQLVGISVDSTLHLWDVNNRDRHQLLRGHQALVEQAQFTPDGQRLVSVSWDRTARIWDLKTGQAIAAIAHPDALTNVRVNAKGTKILTTSLDGTARIIDLTTQATQVILAGHRGAVLDGDFSPDGKTVVTAGADGTARLWNATTGVEQTILRPSDQGPVPRAVRRAFFSPDGQYVATLSENGTLQLWAANWSGLLTLARDRSLRQLTPEECLRYLRLVPNACPALALNPTTLPSPR